MPFVGVNGTPKLWSFCFARASSSVADLSARRAVPSAIGDEEVDQRGVEGTCLRCLAGDVVAL